MVRSDGTKSTYFYRRGWGNPPCLYSGGLRGGKAPLIRKVGLPCCQRGECEARHCAGSVLDTAAFTMQLVLISAGQEHHHKNNNNIQHMNTVVKKYTCIKFSRVLSQAVVTVRESFAHLL